MAVDFKDYYKILGVDRKADDKTIKSAYRRLARKYHPDVAKTKDATDRFKEVSEAYEVLSDPEKRRRYDSLGPDWQRYTQAPPAGQPAGRGGLGPTGLNPERMKGVVQLVAEKSAVIVAVTAGAVRAALERSRG